MKNESDMHNSKQVHSGTNCANILPISWQKYFHARFPMHVVHMLQIKTTEIFWHVTKALRSTNIHVIPSYCEHFHRRRRQPSCRSLMTWRCVSVEVCARHVAVWSLPRCCDLPDESPWRSYTTTQQCTHMTNESQTVLCCQAHITKSIRFVANAIPAVSKPFDHWRMQISLCFTHSSKDQIGCKTPNLWIKSPGKYIKLYPPELKMLVTVELWCEYTK